MAGFAGLDPMPRKRGSLSFRALKSVKNVFGAYTDASPIVVMPPFQSASRGTAVRLTGSDCASAGSFCAVTVTGGSVTCAGGWAVCAAAGRGVTEQAQRAEKTQITRERVKSMRNIMQRTYVASVPAFITSRFRK